MRILAILGVKNEGAFLLEWLAHHRACGFTDFLIFSNDCADGTDALLDRLAEMGGLTHVRNDGPHPEGPQWSMLKAADKHPLTRSADWLLFCDIDEFVNIHVGDRRIHDLLSALPEADAITLTWRMFGNSGVIEYQDRPVTETFTHAARAAIGWPWRAQMFKSLFRNNGAYRKLGVHRPRSPDPAKINGTTWVDGSGRPLGDGFRTGRLFSDYTRDNYGLVQLNHYALGAMESYLVKCDRGRANREGTEFDMGYWAERNFSEVEDRSILALDSASERNALLADPAIAALHQSAVQWRKDRFVQLMRLEPWRAMFGRLLMTPASRTLTAAEAQRIVTHARLGQAKESP